MESLTKEQIAQILVNCKKSVNYFVENFCKIKHTGAGTIPFKLFKYQRESISAFKKHKRVVYLKTRQSGISTLVGAYNLWVSLFSGGGTTCLIVSKRDEDAIAFLERNIKFVYENLPEFFWEIYGDPRSGLHKKFEPCIAYNEHTITFLNKATIRSLTSSKDTLRSNSATLVTLDECAFVPDMEDMWAAGLPTLIHGGGVIAISTPNGKGGWYYNTIQDARDGTNDFHLIEIPWYRMDWALEWRDQISGNKIRIAPMDGLEECTTEEDKNKFGKFKSPWLLKQFRDLQEKGEPWKFRQEILAEFIGSGNNVLSAEALENMSNDIDDNVKIPSKPISYTNDIAQISGQLLNFHNNLWVWETPVRPIPSVVVGGKIRKPAVDGHKYVLGADISSGDAKDWSTIEIIDATAMEQVAELMIKVETNVFAKMIDYLGRFYNNALAVVESTGIGKPVVQQLKGELWYPNLYHRRLPSGKRDKVAGFPTSGASKAHIVKAITDNMGTDGGIKFKSARLLKQANCFIHITGNQVGNEPGADNNDDLMIAAGLACLGLQDALLTTDGLLPTSSQTIDLDSDLVSSLTLEDIMKKGGNNMLYPMIMSDEPTQSMTVEQELQRYTTQLGGISPNTYKDKRAMLPNVRKKNDYFKK